MPPNKAIIRISSFHILLIFGVDRFDLSWQVKSLLFAVCGNTFDFNINFEVHSILQLRKTVFNSSNKK